MTGQTGNQSSRLSAVRPIKYGLGYRFRTLTLTLTQTLKVTIMYAVQNDTEIKFNIVLYISYFRWAGGGYTIGLYRKAQIISDIMIS